MNAKQSILLATMLTSLPDTRGPGYVPIVNHSKRYPANHPLALDAIAKAQEKRDRKRTDKQMNDAMQIVYRNGA